MSQSFGSLRRVRGDNYCALRATLFQVLTHSTQLPSWLQDEDITVVKACADLTLVEDGLALGLHCSVLIIMITSEQTNLFGSIILMSCLWKIDEKINTLSDLVFVCWLKSNFWKSNKESGKTDTALRPLCALFKPSVIKVAPFTHSLIHFLHSRCCVLGFCKTTTSTPKSSNAPST